MPVRSPRRIYEITEFMVPADTEPTGVVDGVIDAITSPQRPVFAKIKEAIGNLLGLEALPSNDPRLTGVFQGDGLNQGASFRRNIGGFRQDSYTIEALTLFNVTERFRNPLAPGFQVATRQFSTLTIGFPRGHTVHEFMNFIHNTNAVDQIYRVITPAGRAIDVNPSS